MLMLSKLTGSSTIEAFLEAKGWRELAVPADGHCLLHSAAQAPPSGDNIIP